MNNKKKSCVINNIIEKIERVPIPLWYLLACVCFIPALFSPFYSDDFFQLLLLSDNQILQRDMPGSFLGLFAFVDASPFSVEQMRNYSVIPWWADNDFYFRFWRPVSELSHMLDFWLFGQNAFLSHAVSVLLFLLVGFTFYRVVQKFEVDGGTFSVLALLIFLVDGQHVATVSWIANRNAVLAAFISLLALCFFIDFIKKGGGVKYGCSLILFGLALLTSEAAIAVSVYLFFYCIFFNTKNLMHSLFSLLPFALISIVWFYFHQSLGYGAEPSGNSYLNPFSYPWQFLLRLIENIPVYFFAHLSSSPAGMYWTFDGWQQGFKLIYWPVALTTSLIFIFMVRKEILASKILQFSLCCMIFSAIPACLANPQDRLSMMQSISVAWFFSALILLLVQEGKSKLVMLIVFLQLVISPVHLLLGGSYMNYEARLINHSLLSFSEGMDLTGTKLVLLDVPIGYNVMLTGVRAVHEESLPESIFYLGNDAGELTVDRVGKKEIVVSRSVPFSSGFEDDFRNIKENPFQVDQIVNHAMAKIMIKEVTDEGYPTQLKITFFDEIDDLLFYRFIGGKIQKVDI